MSCPKLKVPYMVASRTVRQYGISPPSSDLLGVSYEILYPPDTEFPVTVPQIDLFTRFYVHRPGRDDFFVRVWSVGADGRLEACLKTHGPYHIDFPTDRLVYDRPIRVGYLRVFRPGVIALRLCRRKASWRGRHWAVLATEYIEIGRG